jgi:hypothetical protein
MMQQQGIHSEEFLEQVLGGYGGYGQTKGKIDPEDPVEVKAQQYVDMLIPDEDVECLIVGEAARWTTCRYDILQNYCTSVDLEHVAAFGGLDHIVSVNSESDKRRAVGAVVNAFFKLSKGLEPFVDFFHVTPLFSSNGNLKRKVVEKFRTPFSRGESARGCRATPRQSGKGYVDIMIYGANILYSLCTAPTLLIAEGIITADRVLKKLMEAPNFPGLMRRLLEWVSRQNEREFIRLGAKSKNILQLLCGRYTVAKEQFCLLTTGDENWMDDELKSVRTITPIDQSPHYDEEHEEETIREETIHTHTNINTNTNTSNITDEPEEKQTKCWNCKKMSHTKKCSQCEIARYCSKECQRTHWKIHKITCSS